MLNPFKGSRAKSLESELTKLQAKRHDLVGQIADAKASLSAKQAAAERLVDENPKSDQLPKAAVAIGDAERHERMLIGGLARLDEQIVAAEREIAALADAKQRKETATQIELLSADLSATAIPLIEAARAFARSAEKAAPVVYDAHGLKLFGERMAAEVPEAVALVTNLLRLRAQEVVGGTAPPALPVPEAPAPNVAVEPPPKMVRVYAVKGMKWRPEANPLMIEFRPMINIAVDLPPDHADQAVALKAALSMMDPRIRDLSRVNSPKRVGPAECVWIDGSVDEPVETAPENLDHEQLVRVPEFGRRVHTGA